jgi:RNA polymerase sigma factor (sigma-70 family)
VTQAQANQVQVGFSALACLFRCVDFSALPDTAMRTPMTTNQASDPDARVAALYVAHYRHLVGLAAMLTGGHASGEEIAQETFLLALRQERRKPGYLTDPAWPWLRISAVHLAGRWRKRLLRELLPQLGHSRPANLSDGWGVETMDVLRAIHQLPARMRLCLVLAHVEDQSTVAIAGMLGCSTQNVDSQLRKGRARLRTILGEDYFNK